MYVFLPWTAILSTLVISSEPLKSPSKIQIYLMSLHMYSNKTNPEKKPKPQNDTKQKSIVTLYQSKVNYQSIYTHTHTHRDEFIDMNSQ